MCLEVDKMGCDQGLDLWVGFEEGQHGDHLPDFWLVQLESLHCLVRAKKTSKEHTFEVEGLVWDMLCLVKDVCKIAKGINKLQKRNLG